MFYTNIYLYIPALVWIHNFDFITITKIHICHLKTFTYFEHSNLLYLSNHGKPTNSVDVDLTVLLEACFVPCKACLSAVLCSPLPASSRWAVVKFCWTWPIFSSDCEGPWPFQTSLSPYALLIHFIPYNFQNARTVCSWKKTYRACCDFRQFMCTYRILVSVIPHNSRCVINTCYPWAPSLWYCVRNYCASVTPWRQFTIFAILYKLITHFHMRDIIKIVIHNLL